MGTRSVVAIPDAEHGWKGRYCHWDGYPSGVGEALRRIVMRDGLTPAVHTLTEAHTRWSTITAVPLADYEPPSYDPRRVETYVDGYGEAPDDEPDGDAGWVFADGDDWGTEWAYLLGEGGIGVYERRYTPDEGGGHMTGMFGMGAEPGAATWIKRGFVAFTDEKGMAEIE